MQPNIQLNVDILYVNSQSVLCNLDQICHSLLSFNPKILLLSETRTTSDIEDKEISIENYKCFRCDSSSRHTGGVLLYVRNNYECSLIKSYVLEKNYWCTLIKINFISSIWCVGCLYHSPSSSDAQFLDNFEDICENIVSNSNKFVLVGDFNLDFLTNSFYVNKIKNLLLSYGIQQVINEPTRVTNTSETLVDYVLTNGSDIVTNVHDTPKISDHSIISINLCNTHKATNNCIKQYRNFNSENLMAIKTKLITANWNSNSININEIYQELYENCEIVINNVAPIQTCIYNQNMPWFDNEIRKKIKTRDWAYRAFKSCGDWQKENMWASFKKCRNEVVNCLKVKKSNYYFQKIDKFRNNPKEMWKTLKKLIKSKSTELPKYIRFENNTGTTILKDDSQIANCFNKYFIESISNIIESIESPVDWCNLNNNLYLPFLNFKPLTMRELRIIINSLGGKCSVSNILNEKMLSEIFETIGHIILNLVNTSLDSGMIPSDLKTSTVIPIQKIPNTTKAEEFRPINTLPPLEKVLELVVYEQLMQHVENNSILMNNQSGFRKKYSCESALQLTISKLKKDLDENMYTVGVFLDLKRAFETIDRNILLKKLQQYGIGGKVYTWLENFLRNRKQKVCFNNSVSSEMEINVGVPQGSVLGPLLFILYLNDIELFVSCEFINLFADDTMIACSDISLESAVRKINEVLKQVDYYLKLNKLKLNVSKTKAVIFCTKYKYSYVKIDEIDLQINNEKIEIVSTVKYLGFQLDNLLSFDDHFSYINKKNSKKLYFFTRIAQNLSTDTKITVYNTIIQPHFDYCASILYLFNLNKLNQLQKLQNRGMRIILKTSRLTPISFMLKSLEWFSVQQRLYYFTMLFIFKMVNSLAPSYFQQYVTFNKQVHEHNTRNINIYISKTNFTSSMNSLIFKGFHEYNQLPHDLKICNLSGFKNNLKKFIKTTKIM